MRVEAVSVNGGLEGYPAFKDFEPGAFLSQFPNAGALRRALEESGCDPQCLDGEALEQVHALLAKALPEDSAAALERAASVLIAKGIPPQASQMEGLRFNSRYLSDREEVAMLKSRLFQGEWEALAMGQLATCVVEKNGKILEYLSIQPGVVGKGIHGEAIPLGPLEKPMPQPGSAILVQSQRWISVRKGFLVLENEVMNILSPPGRITEIVRTSPDKLTVHLLLRKADLLDFIPDLDMLRETIEKQGYALPIPEAPIAAALKEFLETGVDQEMVILKGRPCVPGENGHQEILVDQEPSLPEPEATGKIDFKNFSFFRAVCKGDLLAKIHPNSDGEVGCDVFNKLIVPPATVPFRKPAGKNTIRTGDDIISVTAACDGRLLFSDGVPEVAEILKVRENISMKTGNITFPGAVEVIGDLEESMEIRAKGDVEIAGTVEDGNIMSDGAIVVRGGFTGSGKGMIKSKRSSVTIGHIRNQRIESHSNIVVYNEVVNAHLYSKKSITMKTMNRSVLGGHLKAYSSIEIANAGGPGEVKTILEVGKDFEVERELLEKQAVLKSYVTELKFLERMDVKLQQIAKSGNSGTPEIRLLELRNKGLLPFVRKTVDAVKAEIVSLEGRLYNPGDCTIWIRGKAFPGTVLKYRNRVLVLDEQMVGKRWTFRDHQPGH